MQKLVKVVEATIANTNYLIPASQFEIEENSQETIHSSLKPVPEFLENQEGYQVIYNPDTQALEYIADHRKKTYWTDYQTNHRVDFLGDLPEGASFERPEKPIELCKAEAISAIDAAADTVYAKFSPRTEEYRLREAQAQAFADSNYAGEAPKQVTAFAQPTGLSSKQAAELILQQASNLHNAVDHIGILRMRKYEIASLNDQTAIESTKNEIIAAIQTIGAQL